MTETVALIIATVDTLIGAVLAWLMLLIYRRYREDKKMPDKHRRHLFRHDDDAAEEADWRARRGRFAHCDPDDPDHPQIKPGPAPPVERQTHTYGRHLPGGYRDGS